MKNLLLQLLDSWTNRKPLDRMIASTEFSYDAGNPQIDADYFLLSCSELNEKEICAEVVFHISNNDSEALIFEFKDEITLLNYRVCWVAHLEEGQICRLIETRQSISKHKGVPKEQ